MRADQTRIPIALVAAITTVAFVGSSVACASPTPQQAPSVAYVAVAGNDAGHCTQASPCASIDRAYEVVRCGGTVVVRAGRYPAQTIDQVPAKAQCHRFTVVTPATGGTVTINSALSVEASYVTILGTETPADISAGRRVGFNVVGVIASVAQPGQSGAKEILPTHVRVEATNSKSGYIKGANNVIWKDSNIGPAVSCGYGDSCAAALNDGLHEEDLFVIQSARDTDGTVHPAAGIVLDGNYLHSLEKVGCGKYPVSCLNHADCIQVYSFADLTIEDNRFADCPDTDFFIRNADGPWAPFHGLTIRGNRIGAVVAPHTYWDAQIIGACSRVTFAYNVVIGPDIELGCSNPSQTVVRGNIMGEAAYGLCARATWSYNFFLWPSATPCAKSDSVLRPRVFATAGALSNGVVTLRYIAVAGVRIRLSIGIYHDHEPIARFELPEAQPGGGRERLYVGKLIHTPGTQTEGYSFCVRVANVSPNTGFSTPSCAAIHH